MVMAKFIIKCGKSTSGKKGLSSHSFIPYFSFLAIIPFDSYRLKHHNYFSLAYSKFPTTSLANFFSPHRLDHYLGMRSTTLIIVKYKGSMDHYTLTKMGEEIDHRKRGQGAQRSRRCMTFGVVVD